MDKPKKKVRDYTAMNRKDFKRLCYRYARKTGQFTDWQDFNFSFSQALYWFALEWHGGQFSKLYSILSTLDYRPSRLAHKPKEDFFGGGYGPNLASELYARLVRMARNWEASKKA